MTGTCRNGHTRTPENTTYRNGIRACLDCQRRKARTPLKRNTLPHARKRKQGRRNRSRAETHQLSLRDAVRLVVDDFESVSAAARLSGRSRASVAGAAWEQVKTQTRRRDRDRCVRCGRVGSSLDVHHRLPRGIGGAGSEVAYGLANTVTLCRECHSWVHANPAEATAQGLLVPRHAEPAEVQVVVPGGRFVLDYRGERWKTDEGTYS